MNTDANPTGRRPLEGRRVLIPRPAGRSRSLLRLLDEAGAQGQAVPFIEITPPTDTAALDAAVISLSHGDFDWVAFTSVNAVAAVRNRAGELGLSPVIPADCSVAAVGPATAAALREAGLPVDLQPEHQHSAVGLAAIWPRPRAVARRVLLPQSEIALPTLADLLVAAGFEVETVTAYRTVPADLPAGVREDLAAGNYDAVLMTSPSTVDTLVASGALAPSTAVGAIGATTAAAIEAAGLVTAFVAESATDAGLVTALTRYTSGRRVPEDTEG
ncbi:uroporphyrinogen-III synthase [Nakamurella silvestris]|nr:uroporphyrinogen-III synthase [Nakamurella silvestris]